MHTIKSLCEGMGPNLRNDDTCDSNFGYHALFIYVVRQEASVTVRQDECHHCTRLLTDSCRKKVAWCQLGTIQYTLLENLTDDAIASLHGTKCLTISFYLTKLSVT